MKFFFFLLLTTLSISAQQSSNVYKINYTNFLKNQAFKRNLNLKLYEVNLVKSSIVSEKILDQEKFLYVFSEWQRFEKILKLQKEILGNSKSLKTLSEEGDSSEGWNSIINGNQRDIDETNEIIDNLVIATDQIRSKIEADNYSKKVKMSIFKIKYTLTDKKGESNNFLDEVMVFYDDKNQVLPIFTRFY